MVNYAIVISCLELVVLTKYISVHPRHIIMALGRPLLTKSWQESPVLR